MSSWQCQSQAYFFSAMCDLLQSHDIRDGMQYFHRLATATDTDTDYNQDSPAYEKV